MPLPFRRVFSSSVGTKLVVGLTGLGLSAYMVLHLVGNSLIFLGRDTFNEYSHFLISNPLIIPIEIGLLAVFLLHIYKAVTMWVRNQAARPVAYARKQSAGHTSRKSFGSSTMIASGLFLAVFVLIHVKQFKFGTYYASAQDAAIRDLYQTEVEVFQHPIWVAFYVLATVLVGLHLSHGAASALQSLGLDHPRYTRRAVAASIALAVLVGGGLAVIPIWAYFTQ